MTQLLRFRFQRCYSVTCRRLAPEDGNEGASKMGLGEKKFKIDWTDKEYRHFHARYNANPVNRPYYKSKEPFKVYGEQLKSTAAPPPSNVTSEETAVRESEGSGETRIQKKIRELEEAERLRYYHMSEYKPKWHEFYGLLSNLDVDYETEAARHQKWRARLDFGHKLGIFALFLITFLGLVDFILMEVGSQFIPRGELTQLQVLEEKRAQLRAQLSDRNWVTDYDKKEAKLKELNKEIRELKKINQEVERLIASESSSDKSVK
ncbi:unnamed protein product [Oikopleura dioica]|uniref:Uncharacterized protein n=1 Tax=Oikopleura dioica TaxID=34765 RepID=E4XNP1_OIKDI|nr:unnamed protein product [Oikopleura dioica]